MTEDDQMAWLKRMVALEEERGPMFPDGFGGGVSAIRRAKERAAAAAKELSEEDEEIPEDLKRPWHVPESTFSTAEVQRKQATCRHVVWYHGEAIIFGYMKVYGICVLCKTRCGVPEPDWKRLR